MSSLWEPSVAGFFSPRGLLALVLIYITLFLYTAFLGPGLVQERAAKLAFSTISIGSAKAAASSVPAASVPAQKVEQDKAHQEPIHVVQKAEEKTEKTAENQIQQSTLDVAAAHSQKAEPPKPLTPFAMNRRAFSAPEDKKILAIAFVDFGLSDRLSQLAATSLPPDVSFILSPYAAQAQAHESAARALGHEIWLQIPLETQNSGPGDPGPLALLSGGGLQMNQEHLKTVLAQGKSYAGVALATDSVFLQALPQMQNLMEMVITLGLGVWEMNPAAEGLRSIAKTKAAPFVRTQMQIRPGENLPEFFDMLEAQTLAQGRMLAVLPLNPAALDQTKAWVQTLSDQNIVLAPVSALVPEQAPLQDAKP